MHKKKTHSEQIYLKYNLKEKTNRLSFWYNKFISTDNRRSRPHQIA